MKSLYSFLLFFLLNFSVFGLEKSVDVPKHIIDFFNTSKHFKEDYTFYCGLEYKNLELDDDEIVLDRIVPLEFFFNNSDYFNNEFKQSCSEEYKNDYYACARVNIPLFVEFENDIYNLFLVAYSYFLKRKGAEFIGLKDWEYKDNDCPRKLNGKFYVRPDLLGDIGRVILYINKTYGIEYMANYPLEKWIEADPVSGYECDRYFSFKEDFLGFKDNEVYSLGCDVFIDDFYEN